MSKKENGSTTNNKHRAKKIIKLIIYIVLLGLLAFISVKSCNLTLKALEPAATSWDDLNNVNIICNVNGALVGTLDPDEYYYMNNGNDENGMASVPAFYIYDTYTGFQYDEIRIRRNSIMLRGYLYDSLDNFSDYYERTIWASDYIFENITPDTIRFENITTQKVDNIAIFSLNFVQNGPAEFLALINNNFDYYINYENLILRYYLDNTGDDTADIYLLESKDGYIGFKMILYLALDDEETEYIQYFDSFLAFSVIDFDNLQNNYNNYIGVGAVYYSNTQKIDINVGMYYDIYSFDADFRNIDYSPSGQITQFTTFEIYNYIQMTNGAQQIIKEQNYNIGYGAGYRSGRETGESVGYQEGYQEGYDDGASNSINTSWVLSLMNTATSILNIEIFPGFKLIYLVGAFIILMFVRFVIGWVR